MINGEGVWVVGGSGEGKRDFQGGRNRQRKDPLQFKLEGYSQDLRRSACSVMKKSQPSTLDTGVTIPGWLNPGYRAAWVVMKVDFQEPIFTCAGSARFAGIPTHYREAVEQTRGPV